MSENSADDAVHAAFILMETYASNIGDNPWVRKHPEIVAKVEQALAAMVEVNQAINQTVLFDAVEKDAEQPHPEDERSQGVQGKIGLNTSTAAPLYTSKD